MTERDDWGFDVEPPATETWAALAAKKAEPALRGAEARGVPARTRSHRVLLVALVVLELVWLAALVALAWRLVSGVFG